MPSASNFSPQAVCYREGRIVCRHSNVFPTKIEVDSNVHVPSSLAPLVSFFHLPERTLKFMDVCIIASFGTVFPRKVVTHTSVFHESDDVSVFVTNCPTDQKSGLLVFVDFCCEQEFVPRTQQHCSVRCLRCVLHEA